MSALATSIRTQWTFLAAITVLLIPYVATVLFIIINYGNFGPLIFDFSHYSTEYGINYTIKAYLKYLSGLNCNTVLLYSVIQFILETGLIIGLIMKRRWGRIGLLWVLPVTIIIDFALLPLTECYKNYLSSPESDIPLFHILAWGLLLHPNTKSILNGYASNKSLKEGDAQKRAP